MPIKTKQEIKEEGKQGISVEEDNIFADDVKEEEIKAAVDMESRQVMSKSNESVWIDFYVYQRHIKTVPFPEALEKADIEFKEYLKRFGKNGKFRNM